MKPNAADLISAIHRSGSWESSENEEKKLLDAPDLPAIDDYYEPWTYDYENLIAAPAQQHSPVARPKSLISGKDMKVSWSANWDDDLGGAPKLTAADPVLRKISDDVRLEYERARDRAARAVGQESARALEVRWPRDT